MAEDSEDKSTENSEPEETIPGGFGSRLRQYTKQKNRTPHTGSAKWDAAIVGLQSRLADPPKVILTNIGHRFTDTVVEGEDVSTDSLWTVAKNIARATVEFGWTIAKRVIGFAIDLAERLIFTIGEIIFDWVLVPLAEFVAGILVSPVGIAVLGALAVGGLGYFVYKTLFTDTPPGPLFSSLKTKEGVQEQETEITKTAHQGFGTALESIYARLGNFSEPRTRATGAAPEKGTLGKVPAALGKNSSAVTALFIQQGWAQPQAEGIVANLVQESNLNPGAVGDMGSNSWLKTATNAQLLQAENQGVGFAYGLAQWHGDRRAKFKALTGHSMIGSSLEEQVAFVNWELNHSEIQAGKALHQARTAGEAAAIVSKYYERPADQAGEMARRAQIAQQVEKAYNLAGITSKPATASTQVAGNTPTAPAAQSPAQDTQDTQFLKTKQGPLVVGT